MRPDAADRRPTMQLPEQTIDDLQKRLRRIEGQVRGIQAMLTDGRECSEVVTQIAAASKAMEQVGFKLVASGLTYCLTHPDEAAESGYDLERVEKMFMKIG
jgi:DNA-binding FrmR family transcriptional regulator